MTVLSVRTTEFPWTKDVIYLNAAGIGPLPERTRRAIGEFAALRAAPHRLSEKALFGTLAESRRLAAMLVNATPEEIALAPNTSYGLNLAARSLPLEPGDIVLVSDREFPANVYPWLALRDPALSWSSRRLLRKVGPTKPIYSSGSRIPGFGCWPCR